MANHVGSKSHTGAHVHVQAPYYSPPSLHAQVKVKSVSTYSDQPNNNVSLCSSSVDLQQSTRCKLKYYRCSRHQFIPAKIIFLVVLAIHFSSSTCAYGHNHPYCRGSVMDNRDETSVSLSAGDSIIPSVSASDIDDRSTRSSNDQILHDEMPALTSWLTPWYNVKYDMNGARDRLKKSSNSGKEIILHPSHDQYDIQRCRHQSILNTYSPYCSGFISDIINFAQQLLKSQKYGLCSLLDDTLQCSLTDRDQDSNNSSNSKTCPLQNSEYLHLYTTYTISTMKSLLFSDDIIEIIIRQRVPQIRLKFFIFWLMIIGLAYSCFHVSETGDDDIGFGGNVQSSPRHNTNNLSINNSESGYMDSDLTPSYHTCDSELFLVPIPVSSLANEYTRPLYGTNPLPYQVCEQPDKNNDAVAGYPNDINVALPASKPPEIAQVYNNRSLPSPFIHQYGGNTPDFLFAQDYPPPVQETSQNTFI